MVLIPFPPACYNSNLTKGMPTKLNAVLHKDTQKSLGTRAAELHLDSIPHRLKYYSIILLVQG